MKVFYTFGLDSGFPFCGGWVEIEAPDLKEAHDTFRTHYPDRTPGILNCSDYYTEAEFNRTDMPVTGNRGAFCHRCLSAGKTEEQEEPKLGIHYVDDVKPENFEPMHKHMKEDRQQEKDTRAAPGDLCIDGQRFTGKIAEPDTATATLNVVQPAALRFFEALANAAREAWAEIKRATRAAVKIMARLVGKCMDAMFYNANDNPKWWHYYKHAKKYRVRKKYQRRLERQLSRKLLAAAAGQEVDT